MVNYVAFMPGVSLSVGTRDITSINGYSAEKHGKDLDCEAMANEVRFYVKKNGERTGDRIRMPMTAVASIRETVEAKEKGK